jgi:hypothetical protein
MIAVAAKAAIEDNIPKNFIENPYGLLMFFKDNSQF